MKVLSSLPPLDAELRWILGRPCFTVIGIAGALRLMGHDIPRKAEEEQAAAIHWMVNMYLQHGSETWRAEADRALAVGREAAKSKEDS